ncbi:MAG: CHAD domain-containing protein [Amphiplicatus sp.]
MAKDGAQAGVELEIKLIGAPADVAALRDTALFRKFAAGEGGWERLVSTYYDTEDARLERAGASLRLREEAGGRVQAMKLAAAGEFGRLEEEIALADGKSFPLTPHTDEFAALLAHSNGALIPVARTIVDRYAMMIERKGAVVEVALDLGRAEGWRNGAMTAAAPLAEAEFELISGDPKALFSTARKCLKQSEGRLRLTVASKLEQARRLARPFFSDNPDARLSFETNATTGAALAASLTHCASRMADCVPAIVDLRASEGVHQMRIALRRFRAMERLVRNVAGDKRLIKRAEEARGWMQTLGAARDWDVFLAETLPRELPGGYAAAGLKALKTRAEALRAAAWDRAARAVAGADFSIFALRILEAAHHIAAADGAELDEGVKAFAGRAHAWRLEKACAVAAGIDDASPAPRHPLRIELKKLRYAAQTFRSLYPKAARKSYMGAISRLQDAFGALNDAVVAQTLANEAALGQGGEAARAAGFIAGWRAGEAHEQAGAVGESWRAFAALTPFWRGA